MSIHPQHGQMVVRRNDLAAAGGGYRLPVEPAYSGTLMRWCDDAAMRITVTIDDDVLTAARAPAARSGSSLGRALSELARRGLSVTGATEHDGIPAFDIDADAPSIDSHHVHGALDEQP